jgi:hypothetical protein
VEPIHLEVNLPLQFWPSHYSTLTITSMSDQMDGIGTKALQACVVRMYYESDKEVL